MKILTAALALIGSFSIVQTRELGLIESPDILFIGSYTYNYPEVDYQLKGIDKACKGESVSVLYKFLNTKNIDYNDEYKLKLKDRFSLLFEQNDFDGVIVSDDDGLDFVLTYYDDFFSKMPVIFQGINDKEKAICAEQTNANICGITEAIDYETNIKFAQSLMPNAKKFNYIADDTKTGIGVEKSLLEAYNDLNLNLVINKIDTSKLTYDEICERLSAIDENDITFYTIFTNDGAGRFYPLNEILQF